MNPIQPGAMIRFGWDLFMKRVWFFIGAFLIIWVAAGIFSQAGSYVEKATGTMLVLALAGSFLSIVASVLIKMGTLAFVLKAHDAPEAVEIKDFWSPETFWAFFGASILIGLIVVAGLILLIVPGIMWSLRFMFVPYLVIDRKLGVFAAMKESTRITLGHKWQLLGLIGMLALLNIAGFLALIVGLVVTIPVTMIAVAHAYRTLEHAASEITPVSA